MSSEEKDLSTGIEGLEADDTYKGSPVFNVDKETFFNNMRKENPNEMKFPDDSKIVKFLRGNNARREFYTKFTDDRGESFIKRIK